MTSLTDLTARLCRISRTHFIDPFSRLQWPDSLEHAQWFMTPELISLHGTEHYEALGERQQQQLSFFELVNFFSINIHGERMLIEGLAKRLYRKHTEVVSPYLHHFLDEENKHMFYFGRFCNQYAGKVYVEKKLAVDREYAAGEEEFLFFARVMLFEELIDIYNRRMAKDQRLVPIAREINWLHHFEEARHLAFGRRIVQELFETHADAWQRPLLPDSIRVTARNRSSLSAYVRPPACTSNRRPAARRRIRPWRVRPAASPVRSCLSSVATGRWSFFQTQTGTE